MQQACRSLSESSSTGRRGRAGRSSSASRSSRRPRALLAARDTRAEETVDAQPDVVDNRTGLGDEDLLEDGDDPAPAAPPSACAGVGTCRPNSSSVPASGACTPLRILTSVLLPEPFSPTSACTSPARSSNDASRMACVGPNAFAIELTFTSVGASTTVISRSTPGPCEARATGRDRARRSREPVSARRAGGACGRSQSSRAWR